MCTRHVHAPFRQPCPTFRCGASQQFAPHLVEAYNKLQAAGKNFEIVYVSSDRTDADMKASMTKFPWLAIPFEQRERKEHLSTKYNARILPQLT